jgi:hypothetical protein
VTPAPLPVAPRPFPDETLCSWADRVGEWYALSGSDLVRVLGRDVGLSIPVPSLEGCELHGETPRWMADLLADATRLPREQIDALRQDAYSRWTPPGSLWKVSTQYWHRRCRRCLIDCGVVHDRRAWRSGWTSYCPSHDLVFGSEDQTPSPHAVCLEAVLIAAIHHPRQQVVLPWPVAGGAYSLPLPEVLATLAVLAEYLCGVGETVVSIDRFPLLGNPWVQADETGVVRLIDLARLYVLGSTAGGPRALDGLKEGWRFQRGLQDADHHALMASLGWLLSDWPENLKRLLQSREFSTPRLAICVEVCRAANVKMLRNRASALVEPLRNALAAL